MIDDTQDTTTKSTDYSYDRILLTDPTDMTDLGVCRYDLDYQLTEELTVDVSDHYPVYAEFAVDNNTD